MACNISIIKRLEVALDTNKSTKIWKVQQIYLQTTQGFDKVAEESMSHTVISIYYE